MTDSAARRRPGQQQERGQVAPLVLVAVLFAALLSLGVARIGTAAGSRASAQAAADAAALAGATQGRGAASALATVNQATLVTFHDDDGGVAVTIERAGLTASARARWVPTPIP
ncbi:pilus assembly protein TadG-related protein [Aquihabitans sp. McL0605]|uniref:pilus assembly protein TadG-related protein n=1 Tax=Aquihabitans sp. McL0605 TaxID=3415671 RepID=UPI003CF17BBA